MKRGQIEWMTAHLGDVLLTLLVLVLGVFLIQNSLHDESFFGFDDFKDVMDKVHNGDFEREHAHVIILDNPGVIVFFEEKKNVEFSYNQYSGLTYLNSYGNKIEIAVPGSCIENCLCYMKDLDVTKRGLYTTLSEERATCYNNVGYHIEYSGVYGDKNIYEMHNGWVIERGLAELAIEDDVYDVSVDDNSKGSAINNQIMARRRTVYLSSNDGTVYVYQYNKRSGGDFSDQTSQSTEYDFVPGEMGGTDHDKQMVKFN